MDVTAILVPIVTLGSMGLLFGIGLGIAAKKFAVPIDERVEAVKACLPGANCGGCGFAGCEAMAKSIVNGESTPNGCPVCNKQQVAAIAKIMQIESNLAEKKVAVVRCKGNGKVAGQKFNYTGLMTCQDAHLLNGGPKQCIYGCLGLGSCMKVCAFDAITMKEGLPIIDREKCVGCGTCEKQCPRGVIHLVPIMDSYHVNCASKDRGKEVKEVCRVGCIGCGLCIKQCEYGAIRLEEQCAIINPKLCVGCGKCSSKCPTQAISHLIGEGTQEKDKFAIAKRD